MEPTKIRVLIVEDDAAWSERIARAIKSIFRQDQYAFDEGDSIKQASDPEEAEKLIASKDKYNLVTMDMDLSSGEQAEGLKLLKLLRQYQPNAVSVVVSARADQSSIMGPSYSQHRAFFVVKKDEGDPAALRTALSAAFQYASVVEMIQNDQIDSAKAKLSKLIDPKGPYKDFGVFKDTYDEIKQISRYQVTGLPGQSAVHDQMDFMRKSQRPWELCSIPIDHYTDFHEAYGSFRSIDVLKELASIIKQALDDIKLAPHEEPDGLFAGYMGEHEFILTAFTEHNDHISALEQVIKDKFKAKRSIFYDDIDLEGDNPRFKPDELMIPRFRRKSLKAGVLSGIGLDVFLKEVWLLDDNGPLMEWPE